MNVVKNILGKQKRRELPRYVDTIPTKKVESTQTHYSRPKEYYCNYCEMHHRDNSRIGKEHIQHAGPHRGKTAYQKTVRELKRKDSKGYNYAMQHEKDRQMLRY